MEFQYGIYYVHRIKSTNYNFKLTKVSYIQLIRCIQIQFCKFRFKTKDNVLVLCQPAKVDENKRSLWLTEASRRF